MLEFVGATDFHLDAWKRFFPSNELAVKAQVAEMRKPFEYAVAKGIPRIFLAGDIGEFPTLSEEARYHFFELLMEFDGQLDIEIILGNHDFAVEGLNNLASFQQLQRHGKFKTVRFHTKLHTEEIEGVQVNFMPYPLKAAPKSERVSLNVAHIEITGAARDNGRLVPDDEGVSLAKSKDHWVIGHFHTAQEGPNWLYLGTIYQKNFGEHLPKGWWHCRCDDLGNKLNFRARFVENQPKIVLETIEVRCEEDYEQVTSDLNRLYKVKLTRGVPMNQVVLSAPNVVGYELVGDVASASGLTDPDDQDIANMRALDHEREAALDPTHGLEQVLVNTLDEPWQVELGMKMARSAAQRALESLDTST